MQIPPYLSRARFYLFLLLCCATPFAVDAETKIEVVGAGQRYHTIAVFPFSGEAAPSQLIGDVIKANLRRSGIFEVIEPSSAQPPGQIKDTAGAQTELTGNVVQGGRQLTIQFWLKNSETSTQMIAQEITADISTVRRVAHQITDKLYQKITGLGGMFDSQIAYVAKNKNQYQLTISDSDGQNPQTILESTQPILSPRWSNDGSHLAYVSFEEKRAIVFVQNLLTGKRSRVAAFEGSNASPAWSNNDKALALTLSKAGGSQIFLMRLDATNKTPCQISHTSDINTEPAFMPDGKHLIFTSNRAGNAQIYTMPIPDEKQWIVTSRAPAGTAMCKLHVGEENAQRLTHHGLYNAAAKPSRDGKWITFITRDKTGDHVALMSTDPKSKSVRVLTASQQDDSPSFSPNGQMILYESKQKLGIVSINATQIHYLALKDAVARQPAWGPLRHQ